MVPGRFEDFWTDIRYWCLSLGEKDQAEVVNESCGTDMGA